MELNNILVHVDAPNTDETIIFMAHTDSVIQGPGAFDDIVSVAALLEGLRAVKGKEIARDLLFLFTDGEEQGLLGSAKFISDHPEYQHCTRLVVNLEARGNAGVLILFETTDNNLELIKNYRQAVSYPYSMSIATSIYKTMQNDTDLTHFIHAGYPGINFTVIDNPHVYHTELDNYETFSRDSAFHYLTTTTGLVTYLALKPELSLEAEQDSVHFPFFPGKLAVIPESYSNVFCHIALALTLMLLLYFLLKKRLALSDFFLTFGAQILALILSGGLTWVLLEIMYTLHYSYDLFSEVLISENHYGMHSNLLFVIFIIMFSTCTALLFRLIRRRKNIQSTAEHYFAYLIGTIMFPAILGEICAWFFPAGGYLFFLPVLTSLAVIIIYILFPPLTPIFTSLSVFVTLLLYIPLIYVLNAALLIYNAYIILPVVIFTLTLIGGNIEFLVNISKVEENGEKPAFNLKISKIFIDSD